MKRFSSTRIVHRSTLQNGSFGMSSQSIATARTQILDGDAVHDK